MIKRNVLLFSLILAVAFAGGTAMAGTSVQWTSPSDGSVFPVGTNVQPEGMASGVIINGQGLDLALVLDSSGSMGANETVNGVTQTRAQWQKDAAIALVNSLPDSTTSVAVIEFDYDANTVQQLTPLLPSSNLTDIVAAINSVDSYGGTNIGNGIDEASAELTGVRHTVGRSQMMVVFSDGMTSGDPEVSAMNAVSAGVDAIHTVGLPGHSVYTMKDIADGPDNTVGTADDYGVYTDASD